MKPHLPYLTRAQAIEQGFTINDHAPGRPIAYKGKTFAPTSVRAVLTEIEEKALDALKAAQPWLVMLGDHIGNGTKDDPMGRCNALLKIHHVLEEVQR